MSFTISMLAPIKYYDADLTQQDTPRAKQEEDPEEPHVEDTPIVKSKADKRRRAKMVKFPYKQHTNVYLKPEWIIAPGYAYPGPANIPHKLVTAAPAPKVIKPKRGDIKARVARSKAVLNRPDKTAFGNEEETGKQSHPRRNRPTWDSLGLVPPGNYYPTGRIDFWPRGEPSKPFKVSFLDAVNTW
jgi:hypothetical protein